MPLYKIADVLVEMTPTEDTLLNRAMPYILQADGENQMPDIRIEIPKKQIKDFQYKHPELTIDISEYLLFGFDFYKKLLPFGGMMLHSSAVAFEGKAYLFSAPCKTGKSTHTKLWQKYLGKDRVIFINDDKPAIRVIDGKIMAYGTPFSGKTDLNKNISVPLGGICFLKQGNGNSIRELQIRESVFALLSQTPRRLSYKNMDSLMQIIQKIINSVPIFEMECTVSEEAVKMAFNAMVKQHKYET